MKRISIFLLFACFLISSLDAKAQTYTPASAGNWTSITWNCIAGTNPCAAYPGLTYAGDVVNITSSVTLTSALPQTVGAITIDNADFKINGSLTFNATSIMMNSSGSGNANFIVNNTGTGSPTVYITNDVTITRNNTSNTSATTMTIGGGSSVTNSTMSIGGNLTYNYGTSPYVGAGTETAADISIGSTANDQCSLTVAGNINLTYNYQNPSGNTSALSFYIYEKSSVTVNNLNMTLTEGGVGSSTVPGITRIKMAPVGTNGASLTVNGNASLIYNDASSSLEYHHIGITPGDLNSNSNASVTINGDLYMTSGSGTSNSSTSYPNNLVAVYGFCTFTLKGNIKFLGPTVTSPNANKIAVTDNSVFNLYGQIQDYISGTTYAMTTNKNQGDFDFQFFYSPSTAMSSIKFLGSVAQNFPVKFGNTGLGASTYYRNVEINNSSGTAFVIPNATMNIQGNLKLINGIITSTSSNYLVLEAGATTNGGTATSFVDGPILKKGSNTAAMNNDVIFPTGKTVSGTKYWAPIQVSSITASSTTTFTTEYFHNIYSNTTTDGTFDHVSQLEYWNVTVAGTPTANITLYWKDARISEIGDVTTGASQDLFISRFNSGSSQWNLLSPSTINSPSYDYNTSDYTGSITASGLSTFGNFTFGAKNHNNNPLPITLSEFIALAEKDHVKISWTTKSEINNDKFVVERSANGNDFYKVTEVKGSGTKNEATQYSTFDNTPISGLSYYRIRQVDYDGKVSYSKVVSIIFEGADVTIYPNPVTQNRFSISVPTRSENAFFILHDSFGNELLRTDLSISNNPNLEFNAEKLTEGIYFSTLIINGQSYNQKILVLK